MTGIGRHTDDEALRRDMIETRLRAHWGDHRYDTELLLSQAMFGRPWDREKYGDGSTTGDPEVAAVVNLVDEMIAFGRRYAADQLEQLVARYETNSRQVMTGTRVRNELRMRIGTLRGTRPVHVNASPREEFPHATV